jgi:hypothetical protein
MMNRPRDILANPLPATGDRSVTSRLLPYDQDVSRRVVTMSADEERRNKAFVLEAFAG